MASGNPALSETVFRDWAQADRRSQVMTVQGAALKALALLVILATTAAVAWTQVASQTLNINLLVGALLAGAVTGFVTVFKPAWSPFTGPLYAACEGFFLGAVSNLLNAQYPGIAAQAVGLTAGTAFLMFVLYVTRTIRVTDKLAMGITAATGAIALVYLLTWVLRLFGVAVPFIHDSGPIGLIFSAIVVGLAAFNLLLDFDTIEQGARYEAPKWMEWYAAFGLMVTLIWLYLEILRLLGKIQEGQRRD